VYIEPKLIRGGIATDDRGTVRFCNGFQFDGVKRFYTVTNHRKGFVRAWHAHKKESKFVLVLQGAAKVGVVRITDWAVPSMKADVETFVLSDASTDVLFIPGGHANGFKTLRDNTIVQFFSTSSLDESASDDFRFDADYWPIWEEKFR